MVVIFLATEGVITTDPDMDRKDVQAANICSGMMLPESAVL
ncbi:hypothetical protein [Adhaeribacter aquaticus]|nr:hypothetical protein [Adhaeribacter aquaticus]